MKIASWRRGDNPIRGWVASMTHHVHHLWVDGLRDDIAVVCDELHHFTECRPLHLLPLEVAEWVRHKVEEDTALPKLLNEQLLLLSWRDI